MANPTKTRVLIVDDHPMIRERLGEFIGRQSDLTVCGEAGSAAEALAVARRAKPDVAIVDLTLKDSNGFDLIATLRAQLPAVRMLVLSMHDETLYAERVLRAGAHGYVTKQEATQSVITALRQVLRGEIYLSDRLATQLLCRVVGGPTCSRDPAVVLTNRELLVFRAIGEGRGTREIAERLNLSIKTVESYRQRIKIKLQIATAPQLIQQAVLWVQQQR